MAMKKSVSTSSDAEAAARLCAIEESSPDVLAAKLVVHLFANCAVQAAVFAKALRKKERKMRGNRFRHIAIAGLLCAVLISRFACAQSGLAWPDTFVARL